MGGVGGRDAEEAPQSWRQYRRRREERKYDVLYLRESMTWFAYAAAAGVSGAAAPRGGRAGETSPHLAPLISPEGYHEQCSARL